MSSIRENVGSGVQEEPVDVVVAAEVAAGAAAAVVAAVSGSVVAEVAAALAVAADRGERAACVKSKSAVVTVGGSLRV
jgi:hypothetical protein